MSKLHFRLLVSITTLAFTMGGLAFSPGDDPIPFLEDITGEYYLEVKLLNFGPAEAYTNTNDPYVMLFHNWKGKTMDGKMQIVAVSSTRGKVNDTSKDGKTVSIPFQYDAKTGRMSLDEKVADLGGVRVKLEANARLVTRSSDRYVSYVEGSLMTIDPQGEQKGWLKFTFKGRTTGELVGVPGTSRSTKPVRPKDNKRVDSGVRFSDLSGQVEICHYNYDRDESEEWAKDVAKMGMVIYNHDLIETGEDSGALLSFPNMTTFQMGSETRIFIEPPEEVSKLRLLMGNIWVNVKKMIKDGTMEVHMSQAVAGIKGTTFTCRETGKSSEIKVFEGTVAMKHRKTGKEQLVKAGETLAATAVGFSEVSTFDVAAETGKWTKPSTKSTTRPAGKALTGPWVHPSKLYHLKATEGWSHIPNYRNQVPDRDADTLVDSTGQINITLYRHLTPIHEARTAFGRWLAGISRSLTQPGMHDLRIERIAVGNLSGWRVSYRLDSPTIISRLFLVHEQQAFILNAIYPSDFGQAELPRAVASLLNSLEAVNVSINRADTPLGAELFRLEDLDRFTKDYSLVAHDRGVVLTDKVSRQQQIVRAEYPHFNIHDNVVSLYKDDPAALKQLGQATSPIVGIFDFRFYVQLYEQGIALHDPVSSVVWVKQFKNVRK